MKKSKVKHKKPPLLQTYGYVCCILLLVYPCFRTSSLLCRYIQSFTTMLYMKYDSTSNTVDEHQQRVTSTLLAVSTEHRQLIGQVDQWLRTQDEEIVDDFIQFMDGKRKSRVVTWVEWGVDWLLGLYKVVAPLMILSLLSGWRQPDDTEMELMPDDFERDNDVQSHEGDDVVVEDMHGDDDDCISSSYPKLGYPLEGDMDMDISTPTVVHEQCPQGQFR